MMRCRRFWQMLGVIGAMGAKKPEMAVVRVEEEKC